MHFIWASKDYHEHWHKVCFLFFFNFRKTFNIRILPSILLLFFFFVDFVIHWNETAMGLHVFPILFPPPTSLSTRSLWVFPVHQVRALVSCIQPGLVICFTLDNIHVSMLHLEVLLDANSSSVSLGQAWDSLVLTRSGIKLMLLAQGPHFEQQGSRQ